MNRIFYNPKLKDLAKQLRNNSTKAEIKLWNNLKGGQLRGYDFHRQKPIDNYIVDFFCNELMLAIEVDGYTHTFEQTVEKDSMKAKRLEELGVAVLRFSDDDVVTNMEGVLQSIRDFILSSEENLTAHTPRSPLNRGYGTHPYTPPESGIRKESHRLDRGKGTHPCTPLDRGEKE